MRRLVLGGLALAIALVVSACGGDQEQPAWVADVQSGDDDVEIGTAPTPESTTSTVPVPGDAAPQDGRPTVDATGDDFERIWREMQAFESWMLANPDAAHASEHYIEGTEIHTSVVELLTDLADRGVVMQVGDYTIVGLDVIEADDKVAHLRYEDRRSFAEEVDAASDEIVSREEYDGRAWIWDLVLESDAEGRWRVASIEFVDYGSDG